MTISEDFRELMEHYNLPERLRAGDFVLFDYEKEILKKYIDDFYEMIERDGSVSLEDFTYFMDFLQVFMDTEGDAGEILSYACIKSNKLRSGMERIRRIAHYESILDKAEAAMREGRSRKDPELDRWIEELKYYYEGTDWKADFAADERGELPADLKRGVLSEDGIYNVLEWYGELEERWFRSKINFDKMLIFALAFSI